MSLASASSPERPGLVLRVGVTGARALPGDPDVLAALAAQVRAVLEAVKVEVAALAADPVLLAAYAPREDGLLEPRLRILSPLAEGADRLVARIAMELGYRLEVATPFPRDDYEQDFKGKGAAPGSLEEFATLLDGARVGAPDDRPRLLELDGARGDDEAVSYGAVGRLVVRNSDLVIAIWDGHRGQGPGGTADTVRFAARLGVPVWWLRPGGSPAFVTSFAELRRPGELAALGPPEARLAAYLGTMLTPPKPQDSHREGILGRLVHPHIDPLARFFGETLAVRPCLGWLWRSERHVMKGALVAGSALDRWVGGLLDRSASPQVAHDDASPAIASDAGVVDAAARPPLPGSAVEAYWSRVYAVPDALAIGYADRYRSSYTLVALFATATVLLGLGSMVHEPLALPFTLIELLLLTGLIVLVAVNLGAQWHARWIGYRLLAELCRKQRALAMLGWSLPLGEAARLAREADPSPERDAWIGWYFWAHLRAAPLAIGALTGRSLNATRDAVIASLVDEQLSYHAHRAHAARLQARGLAGWGEVFALATLAVVVVKCVLLLAALAVGEPAVEALHHVAHLAGIAAVVFAVPSIGLVALRAYAELEMLAESNAAMAAGMRAARLRLGALRAAETEEERALYPALVGQEIAAAVHDVAIDMLAETNGWARLFKVKGVEAG